MCGNEQNTGVLIERVLCTVPVMQIPVYYRYSVEVIPVQCVVSGQRHVVEKTEAHGVMIFSMMSGWSNQGKTISKSSFITPSTRLSNPPTAAIAASH